MDKETVEVETREIAERVFGSDVEGVTFHSELQNAPTNETGKYVSVFISNSSITSEELEDFTENGFHFIEQAGHTTKNDRMDDSITEIPVDELRDAAEVETELVLEVGREVDG